MALNYQTLRILHPVLLLLPIAVVALVTLYQAQLPCELPKFLVAHQLSYQKNGNQPNISIVSISAHFWVQLPQSSSPSLDSRVALVTLYQAQLPCQLPKFLVAHQLSYQKNGNQQNVYIVSISGHFLSSVTTVPLFETMCDYLQL